ncbi:DUF4129 domain-containing protein [Kitasatospora sp. NPDC090091]|uniref:DUF4129 domain-containing protein n=1 Tax=Kitasatospora sp. NPDC090091 TaxID=3364081 RepID=UPI00381F6493
MTDVPSSVPRPARETGGARGGGPARPGAPWGRTPALLLVLAGLLLAAASLRPDGGLLGAVGDPFVRAIGFVVLIAGGWAVLVGRFAVRFREEVRHLDGPTPRAERLREATVRLLGGATVLVPVLLFVFHNRTEGPPVKPLPVEIKLPPRPTLPESTSPPQPAELPDGVGVLFIVLCALAVVAAVVALVVLVRVLLSLRRVRRRPEPLPVVGEVEPEDVLAAAVATGRRALHGADARAAVIACYAAMEQSLAASGVERRICDSPTELLERAAADERVDRAQAYALTELFREARYSTHPMDDGHVRRAGEALDAIAARLAEPAAPADGAAPLAAVAGRTAPIDRATAPGGRR